MLELIRLLSKVTPTLLTHVGTTIRIANGSYMPLTVENIGPGPRRLPALSLCHYGEQNGDAMRDPEMCFELEIEDGRLVGVQPFYYRNDYAGVEQFAQNQETGVIDTRRVQSQEEFAEQWSRNLIEQGFLRGYFEPHVDHSTI